MRKAVKPIKLNGRVAIRITMPGGARRTLYGFGLWEDSKAHLMAEALAHRIYDDWCKGKFDFSLKRYGYEDKSIKLPIPIEIPKIRNKHITQDGAFRAFMDSEETYSPFFSIVTSKMSRVWGNDWLTALKPHYATSTYNKILQLCKRFEAYYLKGELYPNQLYSVLRLKKKDIQDKRLRERREPFTIEEVRAILDFLGFPNSPSAKLNARCEHYRTYVEMFLSTGMRPGEMQGLRLKDLNLNTNTINVSEALGYQTEGSYISSTKTRKLTKTGDSKTIPIPSSMIVWLTARSKIEEPDTYVFCNPNNSKPLNHDTFIKGCWTPLLEHLGIRYRVPYACRHTFASHCVAQGIPLTEIAGMMGHSSLAMLTRVYAHSLAKPSLPDYYK